MSVSSPTSVRCSIQSSSYRNRFFDFTVPETNVQDVSHWPFYVLLVVYVKSQMMRTLMCSEWHQTWGFSRSRSSESAAAVSLCRSDSLPGKKPQITVTATLNIFTTKHAHDIVCFSEDREFRATVVIQSPLEKTPITLQLQGSGSFDEMYRSVWYHYIITITPHVQFFL